jgi:hypothetical protein
MMPTPILNAYAAQLPRLSAEESLLAATRVAVGSGSLKKGEGQRIQHQWSKAAEQGAPVVRSTGPAQYAAHMAGLGIGVKKVKKVTPAPEVAPDG